MRNRLIASILWLKGYRVRLDEDGDPYWRKTRDDGTEYGSWEIYFSWHSVWWWVRNY